MASDCYCNSKTQSSRMPNIENIAIYIYIYYISTPPAPTPKQRILHSQRCGAKQREGEKRGGPSPELVYDSVLPTGCQLLSTQPSSTHAKLFFVLMYSFSFFKAFGWCSRNNSPASREDSDVRPDTIDIDNYRNLFERDIHPHQRRPLVEYQPGACGRWTHRHKQR